MTVMTQDFIAAGAILLALSYLVRRWVRFWRRKAMPDGTACGCMKYAPRSGRW